MAGYPSFLFNQSIYVLASHTGETPALEAIYVQDWTKMQNLQVQIQVAKKEITPKILKTSNTQKFCQTVLI